MAEHPTLYPCLRSVSSRSKRGNKQNKPFLSAHSFILLLIAPKSSHLDLPLGLITLRKRQDLFHFAGIAVSDHAERYH